MVVAEPAATEAQEDDTPVPEQEIVKEEPVVEAKQEEPAAPVESAAPAAKEAAAPAAPEEPAADGASLPLTFRDLLGAKTYTVTFKTRPLCMNFNQSSKPVKVTNVFGPAKQLGVSEGSDLLDIGGTDVEKMDFAQVLEVLKEKIAPLTPEGLEIKFKDQSGQQRPIVFPTKPLGMDFDQGKKPIRIKKVHGAAQSLGVEAEWELLSIAGTDVEQMDFDKMLELLREKVGSLPTKD